MRISQQSLNSGVDAHRAGKLADAERFYKQVLAAEPNHPDAWRLLGVIATQVGKFDVAVQLISRSAQIQPNIPEVWADLGAALLGLGKSDEAKTAYEKALAIRPTFAPARSNLGDVFSKLGDVEQAMAHWQEAARVDPKLPEPVYNIGRALYTQGKADEAFKAFQATIAIDPNYAPAHNNLGVVYWSQNKRKEASECFCRAVNINPNYAEAWNNLGLAWDGAGKHDEALGCWRRAVSIRPNYAEAHNNLALTLEKKGNRDEAIREWEQCLRLRPGWKEVEYYLAVARNTQAGAPSSPPPEYVSNLFNQYADNFDQHMTQTLEYRAPQLLFEAAQRLGREKFDLVIDLGCGTGLCGEKFRPMANHLIGVDLSQRMIDKSRERGIYDELLVGDLDSALSGRVAQLDLVLAGDVLGYVGELGALFKTIAAAMKQDASFLFSVEKPTEEEGEGLILRKSRRFAHSRSYLQQRAADAALEIVEITEAVLRMDYNKPIHGLICTLKKAPA